MESLRHKSAIGWLGAARDDRDTGRRGPGGRGDGGRRWREDRALSDTEADEHDADDEADDRQDETHRYSPSAPPWGAARCPLERLQARHTVG